MELLLAYAVSCVIVGTFLRIPGVLVWRGDGRDLDLERSGWLLLAAIWPVIVAIALINTLTDE